MRAGNFRRVMVDSFYGSHFPVWIFLLVFVAWVFGFFGGGVASSFYDAFIFLPPNVKGVLDLPFKRPSSVSASLLIIHAAWVFVIFVSAFSGGAYFKLENVMRLDARIAFKGFLGAVVMGPLFIWGALCFAGKSNYLGGIFIKYDFLYLLMVFAFWWAFGACCLVVYGATLKLFKYLNGD
ncbi:hypothetical protein E5198_20395 [Pseudomonas sp. A-1]|uniref:hypothetical protein n=1 Tax=Pseudomonas sp. A-1 TaxID=1821274 RepID=UPI0010A62F3D|nr:hypothetical protein [Pseudomonas sp. A-1]THG71320.1 hypothetical protein E5198_20395 [Pseudomonas sp. A-1]